VRPTPALLAHAEAALAELLGFSRPADQALSAYFRGHRELGQQDRAFIAETVFAVLRRKRSLEMAAGSATPHALAVAALIKVFGISGRALQDHDADLAARIKSAQNSAFPEAVQADLPDWLWGRLSAEYSLEEARGIARGLLNPAPLDLRVNLAKISREEALARLELEAAPTPLSPAGIRLKGKPQINRHALFLDGSLEVQDEGSQLLAYLLAPRRGEMVADFCAGAGGKTLALASTMAGEGNLIATDSDRMRLAPIFERIKRAPNTLDAHRLARWVPEARQDEMIERLFRANFSEGRDVGDHGVLASIGADFGLDARETEARLGSAEDRAEVAAEIENAYRIGVTGVPCFIVDRRYAVMGAEAPETIAQAIRKGLEARNPVTAATG